MRQFDRMCKAHAGCVDCPLAIKGTVETKCSISSFVEEPDYIEREVMSWAAEHPEPVYPTWVEWLNSIGLTKHDTGQFCVHKPNLYSYEIKEVDILNEAAYKPIPADIAQKLGIEPKEGV
ncbi:MAG: hypothetical protein J6W84_03410 [Bacteroidales bacterium]|nr:hypothetical protein [Bacteroidales bacterium]